MIKAPNTIIILKHFCIGWLNNCRHFGYILHARNKQTGISTLSLAPQFQTYMPESDFESSTFFFSIPNYSTSRWVETFGEVKCRLVERIKLPSNQNDREYSCKNCSFCIFPNYTRIYCLKNVGL